MAAMLAFVLSPLASLEHAYADEYDTEVSRTAEAYDAAVAEQERIASEIADLDARIATIQEELPAKQALSNESCVALYKFSNESSSFIATLFSSTSFSDALALIEAYNWVIGTNLANVHEAIALQTELEESRAQLEEDQANADAAASSAAAALASAQQARQAAQQAALDAQAAEEAAASSGSSVPGSNGGGSAVTPSSSAGAGNVNWSSDKNAFVAQWAPRINNYLAGSPMAGLGTAYASAAWDYGCDPRWAPAISCTESGKGRVCFRPYNAWGYGNFSFSSYEEGIRRVCACLGGPTYGGYLTERGAQLYAGTSEWRNWYDWICREMAMI